MYSYRSVSFLIRNCLPNSGCYAFGITLEKGMRFLMLLRYGSIRVACNLQHGDWPAWEFGWLTETIASGRRTHTQPEQRPWALRPHRCRSNEPETARNGHHSSYSANAMRAHTRWCKAVETESGSLNRRLWAALRVMWVVCDRRMR